MQPFPGPLRILTRVDPPGRASMLPVRSGFPGPYLRSLAMLDRSTYRRRGFSLTEILVVLGLIVVLLGLLLPALAGVQASGRTTKSMSSLRQIGTWMRMYSSDNREYIVPARFDYNYPGNYYRGKVRSEPLPKEFGGCDNYCGTWSDILWTLYSGMSFPVKGPGGYDYRYDSPDRELYERMGDDVKNPFRSAAVNTQDASWGDGEPTPYGTGAKEKGLPGFFAANNFFDAWRDTSDPSGPGPGPGVGVTFYTTGQIKAPERSMYLVDSFAGEVIDAKPAPFDTETVPSRQEVDFRYGGACLMLFLDGHAESVGKWKTIDDLEGPGGRGIRIRGLDKIAAPAPEDP